MNPKYVEKSHQYFEAHGAKSIILARFIPIVRTFLPFVAGFGKMTYANFMTYNVIGGVIWVHFFLFSGYYFGHLPFVKAHFSTLILAIMGMSLLPVLAEILWMFGRGLFSQKSQQG